MSCCSREEFVLSKVKNMKTWLEPYASPELVSQYDENKVIGLISVGLLPLYSSGRLDEGVEEVMKNLKGIPDADLEQVRTKVKRYLTCFCEAFS